MSICDAIIQKLLGQKEFQRNVRKSDNCFVKRHVGILSQGAFFNAGLEGYGDVSLMQGGDIPWLRKSHI